MLQLAKIAIRCYPMLKSKGLIFVQEKLLGQSDEEIVYKNAKTRALKALEFFRDDMKLDSVEICENLSRDEIIQKFEEVKKESNSFEEEYKHDH